MDRDDGNRHAVDMTAHGQSETHTSFPIEEFHAELMEPNERYQRGLIRAILRRGQSFAVDSSTTASSSYSQQTYTSPDCFATDPTTLSGSRAPSLKEIKERYDLPTIDKPPSHTQRSSTGVEPSDRRPSDTTSSLGGASSFCSDISGPNQQDHLVGLMGGGYGAQEHIPFQLEDDPMARDLQDLETNTRDAQAPYDAEDMACTLAAPIKQDSFIFDASDPDKDGYIGNKTLIRSKHASILPSTEVKGGHIGHDKEEDIATNIVSSWDVAPYRH